MALREIVPAATAPLRLADPVYADREVVLTTLLPQAWPALVRQDGRVLLGLQVGARSGDVSRDLAVALEQALQAEPGTPVAVVGLPGPGPRLQDLLQVDGTLPVTVHRGFDFWLDGADLAGLDPEVTASLERANAAVVPTAAVPGAPTAYWCRVKERAHLRWVLSYDEEPLLDGMARLAGGPGPGLSLGGGTRYVGSFRAHGLLVPVWDLPAGCEADDLIEPVAAFRERLDLALAAEGPLPEAARRARGGLLGRQITLR